MKNYFIAIASIFLFHASAVAQKDSAKRSANTSAKAVTQKITIEQEQWIRNNYQHITGMKKDSARIEIRKNFSPISAASVDYLISRAGKLIQEDRQKRLALVQQMMKSLTAQKNDLTKKIAEKEKELHRTKDKEKIKNLTNEISEMKNKIKELDKEIRYLRESK